MGERFIAWYDETSFWIIPRQGGEARRVGAVTGEVEKIGLTDGSLVWSVVDGGVYRMPLTGGAAERLPGTDGLHLMSWPWANAWAGDNMSRIVNLETGRSSDVALPEDVEMMQCHPQWCTGLRDGSHLIVQRVDGAERRTLPDTLLREGFWWLLGDRYALFRSREGSPFVVYDLPTGTMAEVGEVTPTMFTSSPNSTVFWDAGTEYYQDCEERTCTTKKRGGGKEHTVVNLKAVTE